MKQIIEQNSFSKNENKNNSIYQTFTKFKNNEAQHFQRHQELKEVFSDYNSARINENKFTNYNKDYYSKRTAKPVEPSKGGKYKDTVSFSTNFGQNDFKRPCHTDGRKVVY